MKSNASRRAWSFLALAVAACSPESVTERGTVLPGAPDTGRRAGLDASVLEPAGLDAGDDSGPDAGQPGLDAGSPGMDAGQPDASSSCVRCFLGAADNPCEAEELCDGRCCSAAFDRVWEVQMGWVVFPEKQRDGSDWPTDGSKPAFYGVVLVNDEQQCNSQDPLPNPMPMGSYYSVCKVRLQKGDRFGVALATDTGLEAFYGEWLFDTAKKVEIHEGWITAKTGPDVPPESAGQFLHRLVPE